MTTSNLKQAALRLCNKAMEARVAAHKKRGTPEALPLLRDAYRAYQQWHTARVRWLRAEQVSAESMTRALAEHEHSLALLRDEATWITEPAN